MAVYTSAVWRAKPGREEEFVAKWREMAEWSTVQFAEDGWARLLRDQEDPRRFVSVGDWPDERAIVEWRASEGFKQRMAEVRDLVEEIDIHTLDQVAAVGRVEARA